jgi:predicted transcriptional regulator
VDSPSRDKEAELLYVVSQFKEAATVKEIQKYAGDLELNFPDGTINKYLQRLYDKKLINKVSRGKYFIEDMMFRVFISLDMNQKMAKMTEL